MFEEYANLMYTAHVCERCEMMEEAEALRAEAEKMMQDYIRKLDEQAGVIRPAD